MKTVAVCPNAGELREYLLGRTSDATAASIEEHVPSCPDCRGKLPTIEAEDAFVADFRAQAGTPQPSNALLERVAGKLRELLSHRFSTCYSATPPVDSEGTTTPAGIPSDAPEDLRTVLAPAQQPDELGRLGAYRILKVLGAGGMGIVFLAEDLQLRRMVAVKAMRPALAANAAARQRFVREAQLTAALSHDHVVAIHQVGEERGVPFLAMPLLHGESLETRLKREGRLPIAEVLRIGRETAEGLAAAHERGLIHRDVKPANLWLEAPRGRVKVLDFGLARSGDGDPNLTQSGVIMGTPAYMAPEQAGKSVDHRADLFSLGCTLYRMATGQLPFTGETPYEVVAKVATSQARPPRELNAEVPRELSDLIVRLLAKSPEARPATARDVSHALDRLELPKAAPAVRVRASRRRPVLLGALAAGLLLLLGGAYGVYQLTFPTPQGTFIVELENNDLEPRLKNGKLELLDTDGKVKYKLMPIEQNKKLPPGEYKIRVIGADGLTVDVPEFVMKSGGERTVRIIVEPRADPVVPTGAPMSPMALVTKPAKLKGALSWTVETLQPRGGGESYLLVHAFSPDQQRLATFGADACIRIWDAKTGALLKVLVGHESGWLGMHCPNVFNRDIQALSWSPDGQLLAAGSGDNTPVLVWDPSAGQIRLKLALGENRAFSVAWSPDGKTIATGHESGRVLLWDAASGQKRALLGAHGRAAQYLAWSGDSRVLASSGQDDKLRFWNAKECDLIQEMPNRVASHHDNFLSPISLSPSGDRLYVGKKVWKRPTDKSQSFVADEDHIPPKRSLVLDDKRQVIDGDTDKKLFELRIHGCGYPVIAASPDGNTLAASRAANGEPVALWDIKNLELSFVVSGGFQPNSIVRLVWSPDNRRLYPLMSLSPAVVAALDVPARKTLLSGHQSPIGGLVESIQAGGRFITSIHGNRATLYDSITFGAVAQVGRAGDKIDMLALSPDGAYLLTSKQGEKGIELWKSDSPDEPVKVIAEASFPCVWSPSSRWFASTKRFFWPIPLTMVRYGSGP